ncbi:MAG: MFS transporter [Thermoguttaceae bacterium]
MSVFSEMATVTVSPRPLRGPSRPDQGSAFLRFPSRQDRSGNRSQGDLRQDLAAGQLEGAAVGGMVGLGETYLPAFALAAGLGEITAGMVASLPLLAGGLMQTLSPLAIRRLGSHKRWVMICVLAQALGFVPLVVAGIAGSISASGILVLAGIYWGTGLATGPAWNTWMDAMVPRRVRARFFANRTRASQFMLLAGLVAGGVSLQWANGYGLVPLAFAGIFAAASLCRLASLGLLALQREPAPSRANMPSVSAGRVWNQIRHAGSGPLVLYLVVVQGAVQFSGPYFTPYMFRWLHLSYTGYVVLIATAYLAKVVALSFWGNVARRLGAINLLWIGGIGITPVSALWLVSNDFRWLVVAQAVSGITWGAYELGFFLMFFESIPERERTGVLTFYNLAYSATWVAGSTLGALVLYSLGTGPAAYLTLFGVSSLGRAAALLLLRRVPSPKTARAGVGTRADVTRPVTASGDAANLPVVSGQAADVPDTVPAIFTAS